MSAVLFDYLSYKIYDHDDHDKADKRCAMYSEDHTICFCPDTGHCVHIIDKYTSYMYMFILTSNVMHEP